MLKAWPGFFGLTLSGEKSFEYRRDDRDFRAGDILDLREWEPEHERFTGRMFRVRVMLIIRSCPGLPEGYCIMGIRPA